MTRPLSSLPLFPLPEEGETPTHSQPPQVDYSSYDYILLAFSGGKDSLACLLHLLEQPGFPRERLELMHHLVDGNEGSRLMDWPISSNYCQKVAAYFQLPLYLSWKSGGFEREMNRHHQLTGDILFESPAGLHRLPAQDREGYYNTRRKFPQVSPNLSVRWCSSYLKSDPGNAVLRNDPRFVGKRILFITGERAEESANRAQYPAFCIHPADLRDGKRYFRHIDHYRPVLHWTEAQVWQLIEKWGIHPHPAYYLGFSRCSCMACIFLNAAGFRTVKELDPDRFQRLANYEAYFGVTLKRKTSLTELIKGAAPFSLDPFYRQLAMSTHFDAPIKLDPWVLPSGAYATTRSCGPT